MDKDFDPEWDCWGTTELVCPYCGYVHSDSWEISDDDGKIECEKCGETFVFARERSTTYITEKITKECAKPWSE